MASKYVKLTSAQKDEIRRLTQLANRRIKFALKEYERSGGTVLPKEVVGDYYCIDNPNLKCLNAQDTVMTGHDTTFYCYGNDILKELTGLPKMKYKDIKICTKRLN